MKFWLQIIIDGSEPQIINPTEPYESREELIEAAREFVKDEEFRQAYDVIHGLRQDDEGLWALTLTDSDLGF